MTKNTWLIGVSAAVNQLRPAETDDHEPAAVEAHTGKQIVLTPRIFALYGLSEALNLFGEIPVVYRRQYAVTEADAHHRNESISGFGDLTLGLRGIVWNENYGPGQRLFIDGAVSLPTGDAYALNPFSKDADSTNHRHFALGTGQTSGLFSLEWWWRSEFPFVLGIATRLEQALSTSAAGFKPGSTVLISFHSIYQSSQPTPVFPYVQLDLRRHEADRWNDQAAPNSGLMSLVVKGQIIYKWNERVSAVTSAGFPLWQNLEGRQLTGTVYALSFRYRIPARLPYR